jgi:hypothetical protein
LCSTSLDYYGYCDACIIGTGGVHLGIDSDLPETVYRLPFPPDIQELFRQKKLTNSELEMVGRLLHQLILEQVANLYHKMIAPWSDNTPTVAWVKRLASQQSKIAGRLLRGFAMQQRLHHMCPLLDDHIKGEENMMADISSRSFEGAKYEMTNTEFQLFFDSKFPLP